MTDYGKKLVAQVGAAIARQTILTYPDVEHLTSLFNEDEIARVAILAVIDAISDPTEAMGRAVNLRVGNQMTKIITGEGWRATLDALKREIEE